MARRYKNANASSPVLSLVMAILFLVDAGVLFALYYHQSNLTALTRYLSEEQLRWPIYLALACVALSLVFFLIWFLANRKVKVMQKAITNLADESVSVTPREFLRNKAALSAGGDYTGVYILHNVSRDKYYVGQSVRVLGRVAQHFTGRGNGDVYADYKYGDNFTIKTIPLVGSGYDSLDALERVTISTYDAYNKGYNRTRGNRN